MSDAVSRVVVALIGLLLNNGQTEQGDRLCRPTIALAEGLAAEYPADPPIRELLGRCYHVWGLLLKETAHPAEPEGRRAAQAHRVKILSESSHGGGPRRHQILVVDDDSQIRDFCKYMLQSAELHPDAEVPGVPDQ